MTYTITPNKGHYDVYIDGKLYCTADSTSEAENEINAYEQSHKRNETNLVTKGS
jgi:hypothetical protein